MSLYKPPWAAVVLFDLDGDGAFDDFGLGFAGVVVSRADFLL